ncbi:MAG TPA: c-type cytochrome [Polyangia bacterium]|nr:c-type cytochrome [Polyangia bacterium]
MVRGSGLIWLVALATLSSLACARPKPAIANATVERGRLAFTKYCATCHGAAGNGYAADNSPSLKTATFLASATDEFLRAGIGRGRPGTAMAGYARALGGPLVPEEIDAIIAFLRDGGPPRAALPAPRPPGDAKRGEVFYDATCSPCHGTPAQRKTAVHLANPVLLQTASDGYLRYAIENGRAPTSMIAWKAVLKPEQIDDVLAYLRSMAIPPPAPPPPPPPLAPRTAPVVLNPRGRTPQFTLKEDLYVSIDQVKQALDEKRRIVICDARAPSDWASLHITGAISTPYYEKRSLDDIPKDGTWVVAYCACPHHVSGEVVAELRKRGYKHTAVIDEGIFAWQSKGYPVVTPPTASPSAQWAPKPPPR